MIFLNYYSVILWTCIDDGNISALGMYIFVYILDENPDNIHRLGM